MRRSSDMLQTDYSARCLTEYQNVVSSILGRKKCHVIQYLTFFFSIFIYSSRLNHLELFFVFVKFCFGSSYYNRESHFGSFEEALMVS